MKNNSKLLKLSDLFEIMASALFKASKKACDAQVQHIVFTIDAEGKVLASGSQNIMAAMVLNPDTFDATKQLMRGVYSHDPVTYANTYQLDYPPLPCAPSSPQWKDGAKVRAVLTQMLVTAGYGRHARKYGEGQEPLGWPEDLEWNNFKGATRSKLGIADLTRIITGMLTAAGLDPEQHVLAPVAVNDQPVGGVGEQQGEVGQQVEVEQQGYEGNVVTPDEIKENVDIENNGDEILAEMDVELVDQNRGTDRGIIIHTSDIRAEQKEIEDMIDLDHNLNMRNVGN